MEQLRIPGPTACPPEVLQVMSRQMINHRGDEFRKIVADVTAKLKQVFQTKNDLLILTGSGTGGMESAVVNALSPGDKVLAVSTGAFGDRFAGIARTYGASVTPLNFEWGQPADPEAIRKALNANPGIKAVLVTHNETSTGITNDLAAIAPIVKGAGKLLLVDAVSSLSCIDTPVDKWQIDVAVGASQKGYMVPPGLAFVSISPEAWAANAKAKMPRYYFDYGKARSLLEKGETPWTPALTIFFGLSISLDMLLNEGLPNVFARHARVASTAREGVKSLGLKIFGAESHASNTVTAVDGADGLDLKKLSKIMRDEHHITLAGGQGKLEGKIFRIGHLGWVCEDEMKELIQALKLSLPRSGFKV